MSKILYEPKKDQFKVQWDAMELKKDGAILWIDGTSYEITEDESAELLFGHMTPEDEKRFIKDLIGLLYECAKDFGYRDVKALLKGILK